MTTKVVILQAISGAGKSTYVKRLFSQHINKDLRHVSADHFFEADGVYTFDREKLGKAHQVCLNEFVSAVFLDSDYGLNLIVVDNTNTSLPELIPYVRVAEAFDYEVEIHHIPCDIKTAVARNIHNVPSGTIQRQFENIERFQMLHRKQFNYKVFYNNELMEYSRWRRADL